ncbi:MAG: transposase, partial [Acidobacteriia bacterium]|nr:transposase [Terriglobia bacterium]
VPDSLTVFQFPPGHRRRLRTSNLLERINKEIKRRARVATLFPKRRRFAPPGQCDPDGNQRRMGDRKDLSEFGIPRPANSLDSALGTFNVENVLKERMHVQPEETRFRGTGRRP